MLPAPSAIRRVSWRAPLDTTQAPVFALDQVPLEPIAAAEGAPPDYVYSGTPATSTARRWSGTARALADGAGRPRGALRAEGEFGARHRAPDSRGGAHADANSIGEIALATRAGFRPDQIVFTGVGKSPQELERAVSLDLKAINAESRGELDRIDALARPQGRRVRVALRVNPDVDAQSHPHISTGLKTSKFGVPLDDAAEVLRARRDAAGLEIIGVHVHVGSQITSLGPLCAAAERGRPGRRAAGRGLSAVASRPRRRPRHRLRAGGDVPTYEAFARALVDVARPTGLSLIVEPGRTLVGPAGVLLAASSTSSRHAGRAAAAFVVLDAGMTELMRPALYGAFHRIVRRQASDRPSSSSLRRRRAGVREQRHLRRSANCRSRTWAT